MAEVMTKYRNRYGAEYSYELVKDKTYKFVMSEEDLKWSRWSGDNTKITMFDPSGGPLIATGAPCHVGVVTKIFYKNNEIFIEVE